MVLFAACVVGQQWSENYALLEGVRSNDPLIIDGNLTTVGESQRIRSSGSLEIDIHLPSEAIILLPEKKTIFRVVIHSANLQEFQLMALNSQEEWDKIHDQRSSKEKVLDLRLRPAVTTNAVKLVVRKTSDDGAQKRKNLKVDRENEVTPGGQVRRGQPVYKVYGPLKAPAKIAEIELYGYAKATP
jgi:hypothetical protein